MTNYTHIELNMCEIDDSTLMDEVYERLTSDPALFADLCQHFKAEIKQYIHDDGWSDVLN